MGYSSKIGGRRKSHRRIRGKNTLRKNKRKSRKQANKTTKRKNLKQKLLRKKYRGGGHAEVEAAKNAVQVAWDALTAARGNEAAATDVITRDKTNTLTRRAKRVWEEKKSALAEMEVAMAPEKAREDDAAEKRSARDLAAIALNQTQTLGLSIPSSITFLDKQLEIDGKSWSGNMGVLERAYTAMKNIVLLPPLV